MTARTPLPARIPALGTVRCRPFQPRGWCSRVPAQMWRGRAESRCRCGRNEPSPGADVAGLTHTIEQSRMASVPHASSATVTHCAREPSSMTIRRASGTDCDRRRECAVPCRAWLAIHALQNATTFRSCSARWARSKRALRRARQRRAMDALSASDRARCRSDHDEAECPRGRKRTSTRWTSGACGSAARQRVSAAPTLSGCGCRDALRTALCVECADHVRALDGLLEVREYRRPAAA